MKIYFQNYMSTSRKDIWLMIGESEETMTDLGSIRHENLGAGHENSWQLCFWNDCWKYLTEPCVKNLLSALQVTQGLNLVPLLEKMFDEIPLSENQKIL